MKGKKDKTAAFYEEYIEVNGARHYLLHYPSKPEAPVFLHIHGGPGQSEAAVAYTVEEFAGRNYSIVYYDQRGAGKTYMEDRKSRPGAEQLKEDLLEIVLHVKRKYGKERIGIVGHSWGSVLGSLFALEHPEHLLCYIGCGQVVSLYESERAALRQLEEAVDHAGDMRGRRKLDKLGDYPEAGFSKRFCRKMQVVRKLQAKYHLTVAADLSLLGMLWRSPVIGLRDVGPFLTASKRNIRILDELMKFDLREHGSQYQVPVFYVLGELDRQTPVEMAGKYMEEITAPVKKLYVIEGAGHMTMLDNTEDYRRAVCEIAASAAEC